MQKTQPEAGVVPAVLYSYRFDDVEFNESSFQLRVGGQPVKVQRKPLEVLALLLRHVGEVVTKDELLEAVWIGTLPVENVVANAINKLRAALGPPGADRIVTQARLGYRLLGPIERIAVSRTHESQLALRADDAVPFRPEVRLRQMVGQTESSEVWMAALPASGEQRVYKFSRNEAGLRALKREATVQRYLASTLGPRDDLVQLLGWNFDGTPFFLETAFAGCDLAQWAAQPGQPLVQLSLGQRTALFLQICRVVAAAHSVGVLHKDLKPGNVLIRAGVEPGTWQVALSDFGSAMLTDPGCLDAFGITRLGHTVLDHTALDGSAMTLLYAAPELLAGGPPSTQTDAYALGILLYQLVIGDLLQPLHSGWQRDIPDELLRADIAEATDGDPVQRLSGAAALLQRLERLEERRRALLQERSDAGQRALDAARAQRNRARRPWVLGAAVALVLGTIVSLSFFVDARRAAHLAETQAARANAINRFLNEDILLATDPGGPGAPSNPRMLDVLEAARRKLDVAQFAEAETRASVRLAVAQSFAALSELQRSESALREVSHDLADAGPANPVRLQAEYERVKVLIEMGRHEDARVALEAADRAAGTSARAMGPVALQALTARGDYLHGTGDHAQALESYRLADAMHARLAANDELGLARLRVYEGDSLYFLNRFDESVRTVRPFRTMDHALERIGARYWALAAAIEGRSLADGGKPLEGEQMLTEALQTMRQHVGPHNLFTLAIENELGNTKVLLDHPHDALPYFQDALEASRETFGADSTSALTAQANLGEIELMDGQSSQALRDLLQSRDGIRRHAGDKFPQLQEVTLVLAQALLAEHRPAEAWSLVNAIDRSVPTVEGVWGPESARIDAIKGQILHAQGHRAEGMALMRDAIARMELGHAAPSVLASFRARLARLGD